MHQIDQIDFHRACSQLAFTQALEVYKCACQTLQLIGRRRGFEHGCYGVQELIVGAQRGLRFRSGKPGLGKLERGQLELFAVHSIPNDGDREALAVRTLQLAERELDTYFLAAFGPSGHLDR